MVGDDDEEAFRFHYSADIQLRVVRAYEKKGGISPGLDAALDELQASVDGLRLVLAEEDAARYPESESELEGPSDHESDDAEEAWERVVEFREKKMAEKAERIREKKAAAAIIEEEEGTALPLR
jgi:hypothetical protein